MRRAATLAAALAATVLATSPATAADDGGAGLVSGVEGTKAALVRIETSVIAEIVHINHSTGEVDLVRGRYTVPLGTGTGVFTSADGVIVTAGRTVEVDPDVVSVSAANQLFTDQLGLTLVGNDGDTARRATATDQFWNAHLQHCYDRVEHCVQFTVTEYTVIPHTGTPTRAQADLIGQPDGPGGVAVLRISGGGGTPTAELAADDESAPADALLAGFDQPPAPDQSAATMPVRAEEGTDRLTAEGDLAAALAAGMGGGPVTDPDTGRLVGLATTADDGTPTLVPAAAVRTALDAAAAPPSASAFDAVFRRGVDHLAGGASGGAATSAFEESLTYYDSALAAQHLQTARAQAPGEGGTDASGDDEGLLAGTTGWLVLLGALVVAAVLAALLVRRGRTRRPAARRRGGGAGRPARTGRDEPALPATAAAMPATTADGQVAPTTAAATPRSGRGAGSDGGSRSPAADATTAVPRATPPRIAPVAVPPPARAGSEPPQAAAGAGAARARAAAPAVVDAPGFCSDCGKGLRAGARFCGACGARVG
ncbi:zinc ribbon domain-containing protein [Geodermatophilus sp. SYSU D00705]